MCNNKTLKSNIEIILLNNTVVFGVYYICFLGDIFLKSIKQKNNSYKEETGILHK